MYSDMEVTPVESARGRDEPVEERPGRTCPQRPKASGSKIQAVNRSRTKQRPKPGDLGLVRAPYSMTPLTLEEPFQLPNLFTYSLSSELQNQCAGTE